MEELKQWLANNPKPKGQKTFHYLDVPEHLLPVILRVFGDKREEHPDNAEVIRLFKEWSNGSDE